MAASSKLMRSPCLAKGIELIGMAKEATPPPAVLATTGDRRLLVCWLLAISWFVASTWASLAPHTLAGTISAAVQFLALLVLVPLHASISCGWKGSLRCLAILAVTSFALEALSVRTGIPFGFFQHHSPGPRVLDIPLVVPLGYAVYGWLAWIQACSLVTSLLATRQRLLKVGAPIIGAFILAGYDYPWDAIGASILRTHSYHTPSGLFGVPQVNFLGWLVTGWVAFQIIVLSNDRFVMVAAARRAAYELLAPCIWVGMASSYFLRFWMAPPGQTVVAGRSFIIADILEASAAISLPAMVMPAVIVILAVLARQDPTSHLFLEAQRVLIAAKK